MRGYDRQTPYIWDYECLSPSTTSFILSDQASFVLMDPEQDSERIAPPVREDRNTMKESFTRIFPAFL